MPGQLSMNDVFRFIQFASQPARPPTRLKPTPVAERLRRQPPKGRVPFANSLLAQRTPETIRSKEELQLASTVFRELQRALSDQDATVGTLARLGNVGDLVEQPAFAADLIRLSNTILLSAFANKNVPPALLELRQLYAAYVVLEELSTQPHVGELPLAPSIKRPLASPYGDMPLPPASASGDVEGCHRHVQSVGVADLMVVRQHIKRYEATEIAHVENVMPGEIRSRDHRHLERVEETVTRETETTREQEEELETAERFELNRETSRTIKDDQKYGFELSVSGSYGPVVEYSTGLEIGVEHHEESMARNAATYAKDIMQRSLERVKERVREERVRRVVRETEEKNLHSFTNTGGTKLSGVYQFLEKVYEAQVFNYGKRQMFDLMVPEPASFLWYLQGTAGNDPSLPTPPEPLSLSAFEILYGEEEDDHRDDPYHYARLGAQFGASGLKPPPPAKQTVTGKFQQPGGSGGAGSGPATEHGGMLSAPQTLELTLPDGYVPTRTIVHVNALTDNKDDVTLSFAIGERDIIWPAPDAPAVREVVKVGGQGDGADHKDIYVASKFLKWTTLGDLTVFHQGNKLILSILPFETANHVITVAITCERASELIEQWQLQTYDAIRAAHADRMLEYQDKVAQIRAEQSQKRDDTFGVPPAKRQQIVVTELKKHCISIMAEEWYGRFSALRYTDGSPPGFLEQPPQFDFEQARSQGSFIRFFEHAFEWDQIQYAFYPYFWARKATWADRFRKDDPDYDYQQFLQAGSARVVVPVRPGFEAAVDFYLENCELWEGRGEPRLRDPLYVSIVQELRERTGGREDGIPVGEPWDVRVPTSLVMLRGDELTPLPAWRRAEDGSWTWTPS